MCLIFVGHANREISIINVYCGRPLRWTEEPTGTYVYGGERVITRGIYRRRFSRVRRAVPLLTICRHEPRHRKDGDKRAANLNLREPCLQSEMNIVER